MMKKKILSAVLFFLMLQPVFSQQIGEKFAAAVKQLENSPVFCHAVLGVEIRDAATGKPVFSYNSQKGLVPASTQKIITAAAMFKKYGGDFRFKTSFSVIRSANGKTILSINGNFDPSLGSDRWDETKSANILTRIWEGLKKAGIQKIDSVFIQNSDAGRNLSEKWVWEDMGNYYGATAENLNWKENKFEIHLKSPSNIGEHVSILSNNGPPGLKIISELTTGQRGSGDQAYVFHSPNDSIAFIRGTIPTNENDFVIYASVFGPQAFYADLKREIPSIFSDAFLKLGEKLFANGQPELLFIHESPALNSLMYWFLKKSLNLYGECFLQKIGDGNRKRGIDSVLSIIKLGGVEVGGMKMFDGSGLAPENRVSPQMLTSVMLFARRQSWWPSFYEALPVINGIHMKDGYITGYRCFTGIHKSKDGKEYIFALMANNYDASPAEAKQKLWALLDLLK